MPDPVATLMRRMTDEYGVPYGSDEDGLRRKMEEWREVLSHYTDAQLREAGSSWIRSNNKWPKVSEISEIIRRYAPPPDRPITPSWKAEPHKPRSEAADDRVNRMMAIVNKYKKSEEFPYAAAILDPEFQKVEDEMGIPRASSQMPDWWWKQVNAA